MGKRHEVALIPGDGIGPEVIGAAVRVIEAAGADIEWREGVLGAVALEKFGSPVPQYVLDLIRETKVALKGPVTTPIGTGFTSANVTLRKSLELYASLRPVRNLPSIRSCYAGIDLVVVRENTEGLYSGIEHEVTPGVVESLKIITEKASTRISEFAFRYATENRRQKITVVHKANIMKMSDGLFLECARRVASKYPDIEYEEMIVDSTCMQLVMNPYRFDVLLMENLYGDILSELCSGLVGGVAVVPGANLGDEMAVFEAVHGSAPDRAGTGTANPLGVILSSVLMLRHLGENKAADRIDKAIASVLTEGRTLTPDLGGTATTDEMADAIAGAAAAVETADKRG
ncbi:MAG: isocitrate/isopropylmalate dehydrogenase family protein [Armatimonadota bacterium]|nr:isocitrate/isopropylmalate dehydrogenase family protein [Armatimonadota bacterium]